MERENTVFAEELNPTFLFMWKGTRVEDEPNYHCHEHLELCYIQSGTGKHRIGDTIYEVKEGDLLVINEGVYHQSLAGEHKTPVAEFYVGLTDLNLAGLGRNHFPLPGNCVRRESCSVSFPSSVWQWRQSRSFAGSGAII